MSYLIENCLHCKHLLEASEVNGEQHYTCKAFPKGIPARYHYYGGCLRVYGTSKKGNPLIGKPHNRVVKGQTGDYVFEDVLSHEKRA